MNQAIPSARSSSLVIPGLPPGLTVNFVIGLAILLGGALRLVFVARVDFPYNDGGLFYTLVNELVANGFHLPAFSAYNATHLPVVYPPLAFYLAGLINLLFRVPVVELQRWLPLFFSLLTIPAFAWLSIAILKNSSAAALATLAFALLPNSTDRLLMGGGLTRAPGFFFALIALACIYRLFESDSDSSHWRRLLLAILFSALTVLTHPVYAWFVVCSSAVFLLYSRPKRRNLGRALIVAAGVLLVSAPWWLSMLHTHGLGPVLVAFQSRNLSNLAGPLLSILQLSTFDFSREFFLEILGVLSLVGLVFSLFERKTFWLVWLLVIFIFERTSPVALAVVPLAMLSGLASARLLGASQPAWESPYRRRFIQIGFTILVFYCLFSSYLSFAPQVLTPAVRRSMEWTGQNSAPQSRYLVLTANPWWDDPLTEWFPALADRTSLTTVQGYEWTSPSQFAERVSRYDAVRDCLQSIRVACLAQWSAGQGTTFDYIFIPVLPPARGQAALEDTPLVQALRQSPAYLLVSEQAGALIFKPAAGN